MGFPSAGIFLPSIHKVIEVLTSEISASPVRTPLPAESPGSPSFYIILNMLFGSTGDYSGRGASVKSP